MLDGGATNILDEIIGNNLMSPQKPFLRDENHQDGKYASPKPPKAGGFLDQMKKKHQSRSTYYNGGGKARMARKKKMTPGFSKKNRNSKVGHTSGSFSNSGEDVLSNGLKSKNTSGVKPVPFNKLHLPFQSDRGMQMNTRKPIVVKPQSGANKPFQTLGISGISKFIDKTPKSRG